MEKRKQGSNSMPELNIYLLPDYYLVGCLFV